MTCFSWSQCVCLHTYCSSPPYTWKLGRHGVVFLGFCITHLLSIDGVQSSMKIIIDQSIVSFLVRGVNDVAVASLPAPCPKNPSFNA